MGSVSNRLWTMFSAVYKYLSATLTSVLVLSVTTVIFGFLLVLVTSSVMVNAALEMFMSDRYIVEAADK